MPFNKPKCAKCGKTIEIKKEFGIGEDRILFFECGHFEKAARVTGNSPANLQSLDGKKLFPYQQKGIQFILKSGVRALCADEMGLGKTVQALGTLAMNRDLWPFLIVPKSALKTQWQHETMRWIGEDCFAQSIESSSDMFLPGMSGYIVPYDLLRRLKDLPETIERLKIKTLILDEVQQIKNYESQRAIEVRKIAKLIPHCIALSGTPIKNRAEEYFTILNILEPRIFHNFSKFKFNDCDSYWDGFRQRTGGLRNPEDFKRKTEHFIIRREVKDVKDELPSATDPISRRFTFCDLGEAVEKAYKETFKEFRDEYFSSSSDSLSFEESSSILAKISKMRHLCGLSKIDPCIDHLCEFLGSTDEKIIVFVHHKDVAEILGMKLGPICEELEIEKPLFFRAGDNGSEFVKQFREGKSRVAIISTLAGGEGLDGMQHFCSKLIMLERQWNPANEEQAEKRISQRIGQLNNVTGTYIVATGTIDEFFSEIVERKREIVAKTLGGEAVVWDQSSIMKELSATLASVGGKRWNL